MKKVIVYLSLGSNMGDRMAHLSDSEKKIREHGQIEVIGLSKVYETEPWPLHDAEGAQERDHPKAEHGQKWFLNQALKVETDLDPDSLLTFIQLVESEIGRTAKHQWGNREIDIDILLYSDLVVESDHLMIPHRHMNDRQFILVPLIELEPELKDPVSGGLYKDILNTIRDEHKVTPFY